MVEWLRPARLNPEVASSKLGEILVHKSGKRAKLTLGCPIFPIHCTVKASRTYIQNFELFRQPDSVIIRVT